MITIYSMKGCLACERAKTLLSSRNIPFEHKVLDEDFSREWILGTFPMMTTFPIILEGRKLIGGYTDLVREIADNKYLGKTLLNE